MELLHPLEFYNVKHMRKRSPMYKNHEANLFIKMKLFTSILINQGMLGTSQTTHDSAGDFKILKF